MTTPENIKSIVERMYEIKSLIDKFEGKILPYREEYGVLLTQVTEWAKQNVGEDQKAVIAGKGYTFKITKPKESTVITDIEGVKNKLEEIQPGLFIKLATVGITELKTYLSEAELKEVTEKKLGNRTFQFKIDD